MRVCLANRGVSGSQGIISLYLKQLGVSRKRSVKFGEKRNSAKVINLRKNFAIRTRLLDDDKLIYLNETKINLHSSARYAYSPINTPARIIVPTSKEKNISFLAMISNNKIIDWKIVSGSFNSVSLVEFLRDSKDKKLFANKTVLMDNVRFHKSTETLSYLTSNRISHFYLPPYSPELNPIEEVFSALKNRYYSVRPRPSSLVGVVSAIEWVINSISSDLDFSAFYLHMRKYLDLAFSGHRF
ncbi:hypothetical protein CDIK_3262 [Cucumispora dikerogammari]|nr:hypothetical protein CDIK_3262 [Cucumispora dikerogammari]